MTLTVVACFIFWIIDCCLSVGFPLKSETAILPLWGKICEIFGNRFVAYSVGVLLVLFIAFVNKHISDNEMLIRERTQLPFMFFLLLMSSNPGLQPFTEATVVQLCFVFIIYELFASYQNPEATGTLFNIGVLLGTASLFLPQTLWFLPLVWFGMYKFSSLSLRGFLAVLTGILGVYWLVLTWCVWKHDYSIISSFFSSLGDVGLMSPKTYHIGMAGVVFMALLSFFFINIDAYNNRIRVRDMLAFSLIILMWALIMILLYGSKCDYFLAIVYLPSSVLFAYILETIRGRVRFLLYYFMLALWGLAFLLRIWNY